MWTFRDWEELPLDHPQADTLWDWLVHLILNKAAGAIPSKRTIPEEDPLLGRACQVLYKTGEKRPLHMVQMGDELYSENGFTQVVGVYEGRARLSSDRGCSDGIWFREWMNEPWRHPTVTSAQEQMGIHILTKSGSFWLETDTFSGFVRDFSEVGLDQLFLTYNFTQSLLKKSLSREESCARDFSLQDSLSSSLPIF